MVFMIPFASLVEPETKSQFAAQKNCPTIYLFYLVFMIFLYIRRRLIRVVGSKPSLHPTFLIAHQSEQSELFCPVGSPATLVFGGFQRDSVFLWQVFCVQANINICTI